MDWWFGTVILSVYLFEHLILFSDLKFDSSFIQSPTICSIWVVFSCFEEDWITLVTKGRRLLLYTGSFYLPSSSNDSGHMLVRRWFYKDISWSGALTHSTESVGSVERGVSRSTSNVWNRCVWLLVLYLYLLYCSL